MRGGCSITWVLLLGITLLGVVGCGYFDSAQVANPAASGSPDAPKVRLGLSINGVGLGMSLDEVRAIVGDRLHPDPSDPSGSSYRFDVVMQGLERSGVTVLSVDSEQRVELVTGDRLELNGHRIVEDYRGLSESERQETLQRVESLLGRLDLKKQFGGARAYYPKHRLSVSISKNGAWSFRLEGTGENERQGDL